MSLIEMISLKNIYGKQKIIIHACMTQEFETFLAQIWLIYYFLKKFLYFVRKS